MAKILDGRVVRNSIAEDLKSEISTLQPPPKLVIIQVGDNPESNTYIGQKIKFGEKIGAIVEHKKFPANISSSDLKSYILNLNSDPEVHGIIIQLPIPETLDKNALIELIDPKKDVDGLTTTNQKLLEEGRIHTNLLTSQPHPPVIPAEAGIQSGEDPILNQVQDDRNTALIPATAKGVISILNFYNINPKGKKATVVGRSKLVGAPVAILLKNLGATVEVGHSQTPDLTAITKPADIIVVAVGNPNLITKGHVSPGQTIIDVGINIVSPNPDEPLTINHKRSLVGDVNFAEVEPIVAAITPVPGGIGPMTVASLFENLLEAYIRQNS